MTPQQLLALPEEITLTGYIKNREVAINGEWLNPDLSKLIFTGYDHTNGFGWGKMYEGTEQLSLAVLMEFMSIRDALTYYQEFKYLVITELPMSNFDVVIPLRKEIGRIMEMKILK